MLRQTVTPPSPFVRRHDIRMYENRFRRVKEALPAHAVLGYISDPGRKAPPLGFQMGARSLHEAFYAKRFFLAQYVLLPAILVDDTEHALIVGNFDPPSAPDLESLRGLVLLRDFGDGVMLFTRRPK